MGGFTETSRHMDQSIEAILKAIDEIMVAAGAGADGASRITEKSGSIAFLHYRHSLLFMEGII